MESFRIPKLVLGAAGLAVASVGLGFFIGTKMAETKMAKAKAGDAKAAGGGAEWPTSSPAAAKAYANPKPIVVVGSVNADMFFDVKQLPAEGETISADVEADYVKPGGKGANQAVACRQLSVATDTNVHFIGRFGNDAHGPWARKAMEFGYGVDLTHSTRAAVAMGQAFIYVDQKARNSIVLVGSANMSWPSPNPLSKAQEKVIAGASLLLLQREIPDAVNIAAAKVAYAAGVRVLMDVGGQDTPFPDEIAPYLYALAPNETELARLTGMPTESDSEIAASARVLLSRGVRNVLVTLGTRGSLWFSGDGVSTEPVFAPCFKAPKVVDTTGAGDCFRAAFATAVSEGKDVKQSMAFASAASALCVGVKGAMPSMPARADVLRFLAAQQSK